VPQNIQSQNCLHMAFRALESFQVQWGRFPSAVDIMEMHSIAENITHNGLSEQERNLLATLCVCAQGDLAPMVYKQAFIAPPLSFSFKPSDLNQGHGNRRSRCTRGHQGGNGNVFTFEGILLFRCKGSSRSRHTRTREKLSFGMYCSTD